MSKSYLNTTDREFKKAFRCNLSAYDTLLRLNKEGYFVRNLILFYSLECGLKYLLMRDVYHVRDYKKIDKDIRESYGHDLNKLLKDLRYSHQINVIRLETKNGQLVTISKFHELCRYHITVASKCNIILDNIEKEMKALADVINEYIN